MASSGPVQAPSPKKLSINLSEIETKTLKEVEPMTSLLRNAFLALVAFAALAIIVMMAMTAEAAEAKDQKPAAETAASADTARQIVVEEKAKPSNTVTPAKDDRSTPTNCVMSGLVPAIHV